ncbi:hypothetical protein Tco_1118030, partial [Tanacetum coccineum]
GITGFRSNMTSLQTESTKDNLGTTRIRSSFTPMMTEGNESTCTRDKKKKNNINVPIGTGLDYAFPSLREATGTGHDQDEGLVYGNTTTGGSLGQIPKISEVSHIGSNHNKEAPSSYIDKLNPTSSTNANLRKLDANMPNDVDFDIWLPLASFHEVNDHMKISLYGHFIGKRLAFPVVEWSDYERILIEINACNGFIDNLVMAVDVLSVPDRVEFRSK